jgi:copper resistance protein B
MKRVSLLLGPIALGLLSVARGAEDHSAHGRADHPQADEHAQHGSESSTTSPDEAQRGRHEGHQKPAREADEHAQHRQQKRDEPTPSELAHVPPDPPQNPMHAMSSKEMIELMAMDDTASFGMLQLDQLEWREIDDESALAWEAQAWYGGDYNKVWFKTEGERVGGEENGRAELLWDHVFATWWTLQAGARQDFGDGPSRTWAAVGVQGLAPYFFEIEATLYVGEGGRTAARFSAEYDMLLTQQLILQPEFELEAYGKDDPENEIASGFSDVELGLRLRYEIRREFAPYIGLHWERRLGDTEDLVRAEGGDVSDLTFTAGVRAWF